MVEKRTLKNGVRILSQHLPHVRSCAVGVWVEVGSRHESPEQNGASHFIEHMLFKGTDSKTAAQLAEQFDAIGGQVNAFTTKEHTCYYARTLDTSVQEAAQLLADMYLRSLLSESDVDMERGVINEEIGMCEDMPDDLVNELLFEAVYGESSLARPILGTKETLVGLKSAQLKAFHKNNYVPESTIISICGSFSPDDLSAIISMFEGMEIAPKPTFGEAIYKPAFISRKKDIEQNHIIIGLPGIPLGSQQRFDMQVFSNILGGGMSSRLFQRVREQSGLCYSIYSFCTMYSGTGLFGIYTALGKSTEQKALELIHEELVKFIKDGPKADELDRAKQQLKSNILMGMESTISRMNSMARNEMVYGKHISEEDMVSGVECITSDSIVQLARQTLDFSQLSMSVVGDVSDKQQYLGLFE